MLLNLPFSMITSYAVTSTPRVGTVPLTIMPLNLLRKGFSIYNRGQFSCYIKLGTRINSSNYSYYLGRQTTLELFHSGIVMAMRDTGQDLLMVTERF